MLTRAVMSSDPSSRSVRRGFAWIVVLLVVVAGCGSPPRPEVNVLDLDLKDQVVFAATKCEVPNANGVACDKKTCKTDEKSNCEYFAERCLKTGHNYNGTSDAGTCTRVAPP